MTQVPLDCRLVVDGAIGAHANLALEEAMLRENKGLVVRLWTNERSVIIGRAQLARYETDLEQCAKAGIPVVRRVTAGGTVYHGPGNVNWSLFVGRQVSSGGIRYIWGVGELFKMAAGVVTEASGRCGVSTWLEEPNRVVSAGGKVSGMAAYISRESLLVHGTFLLGADLDEAKTLTDPDEKQLERRYTRSRAMKMANTGIGLASFIASFRDVVAEKVGRELEIDQPREGERRTMESLIEKYESAAWNLGDPFEAETR
ncbi:MAG: lipoate--protein ligase family protein [Thaumarchaeota archaeon]|nr:lipoate--protein ligase family protein [Nitrososphaerota archaeon]